MRKLPRAGKKCVRKVAAPASMDKRSFRWIILKKKRGGLLIGCPRGQWAPRKARCKVGTRPVEIVLPRKNGRCGKGYVKA